jgi:hypothetical protein
MPTADKQDQYKLIVPTTGKGPADHKRVLRALQVASPTLPLLQFYTKEFFDIYYNKETSNHTRWEMLKFIEELRLKALDDFRKGGVGDDGAGEPAGEESLSDDPLRDLRVVGP